MIINICGYEVIIDKDDYEKIIAHRRHVKQITRNAVYFQTRYSKNEKRKGRFILHRLIMNAPKGVIVDHINGKTLDNRKQNLRLCSHSENVKNAGVNKNNRLGVKGVRKLDNHYEARIQCNKKRLFIGCFMTLEEAETAYKQKANELFGEFSRYWRPE